VLTTSSVIFHRLTVSRVERRSISHGFAKAEHTLGERVLEVAVGPGVTFEKFCQQIGAGDFQRVPNPFYLQFTVHF
jgi:hypothetical protein